VFFAEPLLLRSEYGEVYRLFAAFYRQDPRRGLPCASAAERVRAPE